MATDSLREFADAIERNDLDAAERHLVQLEREIDSLARALQSANETFTENHFGPRERAMAEGSRPAPRFGNRTASTC